MNNTMAEHQDQIFGGAILTIVGFAGLAAHWYHFLQSGVYYNKVIVMFPFFGFFGLLMIFFPETAKGSEKLSDYSISQIFFCLLAFCLASAAAGLQFAYLNGYLKI
jgi:hypothetical protein